MKDALWFRHDSNARGDLKIKSLRKSYGWGGYGWSWLIIEMLRDEEGHRLQHSELVYDALAEEMQTDTKTAQKFITDCIEKFKLFQSDGSEFWSPSLLRRLEESGSSN